MRFLQLAFCFFFFASGIVRAQSWEEIRHLAEVQHEIVMLLIEQQQFEKVPEAANEIFHLSFPPDREHLILVEVELLVDALVHHQQISIAHLVVDSALKCDIAPKSKAQLHREKGYLFKKEGKTEEALKSFEMSKQFEADN